VWRGMDGILYGILHDFVADVKSTIGEQTDW